MTAFLNLREKCEKINTLHKLKGKDRVEAHHLRLFFKEKGIRYKNVLVNTHYERKITNNI